MAVQTRLSSPCLFYYARKAWDRVRDAPSDRAGGQREATPALVFAPVAIEAFINEVDAYVTQLVVTRDQGCAAVREYQPLINDRAPLLDRIYTAKATLTGEPYDRGARAFQDLKLLIEVRNNLVHTHPQIVEFDAANEMTRRSDEAMLEQLASLNILADDEDHDVWWLRLQNRAAARWACDTVSAIVHSIRAGVPSSGHLGLWLDTYYADHFAPVPESDKNNDDATTHEDPSAPTKAASPRLDGDELKGA